MTTKKIYETIPDMNGHGLFIVFDGLDGVGKTTLAKIICQKYNAEYIRALSPRDNAVISHANQESAPAAKIHDLSLKFIKNTANHISSLATGGTTVVLDRYIYSCIAYYYAISTTAGIPAIPANYEKYKFPYPDLVFFINSDISTILSRTGTRPADFTDILTTHNQMFRQYVIQCLHEMTPLNNTVWVNNNGGIDTAITTIDHTIHTYIKSDYKIQTARHYTNDELLPIFHTLNKQFTK